MTLKLRLLLILFSMILLFFSGEMGAHAQASAGLLVSPRSVTEAGGFRVLAASKDPLQNSEILVTGPNGRVEGKSSRAGGGPPYWVETSFQAGETGTYRVLLSRNGATVAGTEFTVSPQESFRPISQSIWDVEASWSSTLESLYSAWLERLFLDAEEGDTWKHLHEVIRSPEGNLLYNHLGKDEDRRLTLEPDCADNPFVLRAYFSWKLGLPYAHFRCDRGTAERAPLCGEWITNREERRAGQGDVQAFQAFVRAILNDVHSGSGRTALEDDRTDLYPVALEREHLRPGVVFADPYGHTLTLVRWVPQTGSSAGRLLAVDAQPDGTIAVKRFWQGNFFFFTEGIPRGPGFKAFRPLVMEKSTLQLLNNSAIAEHPDYGDFSLEQQALSPQIFYDRMDRLINPDPLDPETAFRELHRAVFDRLEARALAVRNGEAYTKQNGFAVIPMPSGAGIFQTIGPWEDYSTPARDMRLLISFDVLLDFPDKLARNPAAFRIPAGKTTAQIKTELESLHRRWAEEYHISYAGSDGGEQVLSMGDVIDRLEALEMGYNPNDCIEVRWGAPEGSAELANCSRRAPEAQRAKMRRYRRWFRERVIPIR
jgi:hypothetical protein